MFHEEFRRRARFDTMAMNSSRASSLWRFALVGMLVVALAAAAIGWRQALEARRDVDRLRSELEQASARVRTTETGSKRVEALEQEIARLTKETEDLHRLRGQYLQWEKLKTQHAQLQEEYQRVRAAQQAAAQAAPTAPAVAAARPPGSWIGVTLAPGGAGGVVVQSVVPGGPAAAAGLIAGDVITAVDGAQVGNVPQFQATISARPAGQSVRLDILRGTAAVHLGVITGAYPR
jgi:C-terminal processing protease CtpA/Prc